VKESRYRALASGVSSLDVVALICVALWLLFSCGARLNSRRDESGVTDMRDTGESTEQLQQILRGMTERKAAITPPQTKAETYGLDMLNHDIERAQRILARRAAASSGDGDAD